MARIDVPDGPGGDAAMVWSLRPEMAGMVDRMIATAYQRSKLPAAEREVARMRIAQLNACDACATFRAPSVVEAGVTEEMYEHVDEWRTWPGYTDRQRLAIEYAERFAADHRAIDDELFTRLRAEFADDEILDLTLCCAVFVGLGRTLEVLRSPTTATSTSKPRIPASTLRTSSAISTQVRVFASRRRRTGRGGRRACVRGRSSRGSIASGDSWLTSAVVRMRCAMSRRP